MNQPFVLLSIALLSLSNAVRFVSSSQPPVMSPTQPPVMSPTQSQMMSPIQSPVMSPTSEPSNSDCSSVIYSMVDCLSFLTIGSTDSAPTKTCCVGVKSVLEFNPQCLCSGLESSREMGFVLDDRRALAIPKTCNVPIDPHCVVTTPAAQTPVSPSVEPPMPSPSSPKSPAITPSLPTVTPSTPVVTPSTPVVTPSPPVVTPSPPVVTPSPPAVIASSPTKPVPSSTKTVSSPKMAASSPAAATSPSPSISSTENLSLSKLFVSVMIVFSFGFILA